MFCPKCGTENPEGAKFCSKCGAELAPPAGGSETPAMPPAETSIGLQPNIAGLLCYVALWVTGIVFVVIEKKSTFVKFHAWQSIMTFGILTVVQIVISILGAIAVATLSVGLWGFVNVVGILVWLLTVGLWIAFMVLAYSGKMWKVPLVGDWAEKQASKVS
ncbi:hypothetical protein ES706_05850 [subsurface metagenome]